VITRALVTGGAGFIGSCLVDRLVDDGAAVLVVDDLSTGKLDRLAAARRSGDLTFHQLDIRAPELSDVAYRFEPEVVFHTAAQISVPESIRSPVDDAVLNVAGSVNVIQASADAGADRIVYVSSGGAIYGDADELPTPESAPRRPASPYGVSKSVVEEYLRYYREQHGLDYVAVGPSNVYGPRQDASGEGGVVAVFADRLLRGGRPTIHGDGSQTRDFVFVEDVVDAAVRAGELGGGLFCNVSTGVETSILELFDVIRSSAGVAAAPVFGDARPGDVSRSALDPSLAKATLGWAAWTSLADGIGATVDWFRPAR
jgi:UDP-glucose 4-epimerase